MFATAWHVVKDVVHTADPLELIRWDGTPLSKLTTGPVAVYAVGPPERDTAQEGAQVPLHTHPVEEAWVVTEGSLTLQVGDDTVNVDANSVVRISPGVPHAVRVMLMQPVSPDPNTQGPESVRRVLRHARHDAGVRSYSSPAASMSLMCCRKL
jgi:hypothetical protein